MEDAWSPDLLNKRRAKQQMQQQQKRVALEETIVFFHDDVDSDDEGSDVYSGDDFISDMRIGMIGLGCGGYKKSKGSRTAKKISSCPVASVEESLDTFFFSLYEILNIDDVVVSACRDDLLDNEGPILGTAVEGDWDNSFPITEIHTKSLTSVSRTGSHVCGGDVFKSGLSFPECEPKEEDHSDILYFSPTEANTSTRPRTELTDDFVIVNVTNQSKRGETGKERTISTWNRVKRAFIGMFGSNYNITTASVDATMSKASDDVHEDVNIVNEDFKIEIVHGGDYGEGANTINPKRVDNESSQKAFTKTEWMAGSQFFSGITNCSSRVAKQQKSQNRNTIRFFSRLKPKTRAIIRKEKGNNSNNKDDALSSERKRTCVSKIILSVAGDSTSTTVITVDESYNTNDIDDVSYETPGKSTNIIDYHLHRHHDAQPRTLLVVQ